MLKEVREVVDRGKLLFDFECSPFSDSTPGVPDHDRTRFGLLDPT